MPNLKDIKRRMGSVKKTRQITSAMKLVSGAKLRRATEAATSARPYKEKMQGVLARVAGSAGTDAESPLLAATDENHRILLVIVTSDRGLCGAFNSALLRRTEEFIRKQEKAGKACDLLVYGRKGRDYLRARKYDMVDAVLDYTKLPKMETVRELSARVVAGFTSGTYETIYLVSNEFVNTMIQRAQFQQILPLSVEAEEEDGKESLEYEYEPDPNAILDSLLPLFLRTLLLQGFLETEAGEHAARMTAMDNATRNASDLLDQLTLDYNRARQAAITNEIIEIVSGAEAL